MATSDDHAQEDCPTVADFPELIPNHLDFQSAMHQESYPSVSSIIRSSRLSESGDTECATIL